MIINEKKMANSSITAIIEKTDYGIYFKFSGKLCLHDIQEWYTQVKSISDTLSKEFSVILDLRSVKPLCYDAARMLTYGRAYLAGRGMIKIAIVYDTSATIIELMKSFSELNQNRNVEKHFLSTMNSNWHSQAIAWIKYGIEL